MPPSRVSRSAPTGVPLATRAAQPGCVPARAPRLPNDRTARSRRVVVLRRRPTGVFPPQRRPPAGGCLAIKFQG